MKIQQLFFSERLKKAKLFSPLVSRALTLTISALTVAAIISLLIVTIINGDKFRTAKYSESQLKDIQSGFELRRDAAFEALRGVPFSPAPTSSPLSPGRPRFTRLYGHAITDFAIRALWNDEQIDHANQLLRDYAVLYIQDRPAQHDRDNFYWSTDVLCRIIEFFGSKGSVSQGKVSKLTEDLILEMMWLYAKEMSKVNSLDEVNEVYAGLGWNQLGTALPLSANYADTQTWDIIESENHHAMNFITLWHFSKLLSQSSDYKNRRFDDGYTAAEHYTAWTNYAIEYLRQRAKKGLFVEMADCGYNAHTLKGIYNLHDFADNETLRSFAANLLTLYFAAWGQEQIDGVRGGGKSRMHEASGKDRTAIMPIRHFMWYYMGMGKETLPSRELYTIITSSYRLPTLIINLILDVDGRGEYVVENLPLGLARDRFSKNPHYRLNQAFGGIVRLSYCTPDFIMGLPMVDARPHQEWTLISSQSRWQGVIFAGNINARIIPQCKPDGSGVTYNNQWGIQCKGTMITQRLADEFTTGSMEGMQVWFSNDGLSNRFEKGGWVFVEAPAAYAAVRPARGAYDWIESLSLHSPDFGPNAPEGKWMRFADGDSPAIIEVARKQQYDSYTDFQNAVISTTLGWHGDKLIYESLNGDTFVFHADHSHNPEVNGSQMQNNSPKFSFRSPFVKASWNSDVITIEKDGRSMVLDFSY